MVSIVERISNLYKKVDAKVGGILPGGVPVNQNKEKVEVKTQEPSKLGVTVTDYVNAPSMTVYTKDGKTTKIEGIQSIAPIKTGGGGSGRSSTINQPPQGQETLLTNQEGYITGVESDFYRMSLPVSDWRARLNEIERLQKVMPQIKYFNPETYRAYNEQQVQLRSKGGDIILTTTPVKVYIDPKTNKPIENINEYLLKNNIPLDFSSPSMNAIQFKESLKEPRTYDINTIYTQIRKLDTGYAMPVTEEDIFTLVAGGKIVNAAARGAISALTATQLLFSKPIVSASEMATGLIPDNSVLGQVEKGAALLATLPLTGVAYATELGKSLAINPVETGKGLYQFAKQKPVELTTLFLGGHPEYDIKLPKLDISKVNLKAKPTFGSFGKDITGLTDAENALGLQEAKFKVSWKFPKIIENTYTRTVDRILMQYKPVEKLNTGEQFILGIKGEEGNLDIGLIPERGKIINKASNKPTLKGAYGTSPEYLMSLVNKELTVTHSASDALFNAILNRNSKELIKSKEIAEKSGGFYTFFGTPSNPKTGEIYTRISRLGSEASIWDLFKGEFTTQKPTGRPQILIFEKQKIGFAPRIKEPKGQTFNVLLKSSELEVGLPVEAETGVLNILRRVKKAGITIINGQRVSIQFADVVRSDSVLGKKNLDLLKKQNKEGLTKSELDKLKKGISEETGISYSNELPYFDLDRLFSKALASQEMSMSKLIESTFKSSGKSSVSKPSKPSIPYAKSSNEIISSFNIPSYPSIPSVLSPSIPSKLSKSSLPSRPSKPSKPSFPSPPKTSIKEIPPLKLLKEMESKPKKSLGQGYNVYGKLLKTNKMERLNQYPLTKSRCEDIGAYYVTQTLAKTFIVKKTNATAQPDYQFMYIPEGYFKSEEYKLRNYRIKNKQMVQFDEERFIQKGVYGLSTEAEKKQIQEFRKQVKSITG